MFFRCSLVILVFIFLFLRLYRTGTLGSVISEIENYIMDLVGAGGQVGRKWLIILNFTGKVMLTINQEPGFIFIGRNHQLNGWNLSGTAFIVLR